MPEQLPNAKDARIDQRKLRDYVLNTEHSSGKYKAEFFAPMGYNADNWERLEHDIREQHLPQPVKLGQPSPFGKKYTITASLKGPEGDARQVTTVWMIRIGNDFAELVTIVPADKPEDENES